MSLKKCGICLKKDSFKKLLTYVDDVDCMKRKWDKIKALLNAAM